MNELKVYRSPKQGDLRVMKTGRGFYFCLSDVCAAIGLDFNRAHSKVVGVVAFLENPTDSWTTGRKVLYVDELNFYRLIFRPRTRSVLRYQEWVFANVLQNLRSGNCSGVTKAYSDSPLKTITVIAEELFMDAATLNLSLSSAGVIYKSRGGWRLRRRFKDLQIGVIKEYVGKDAKGEAVKSPYVLYTKKGWNFIKTLSQNGWDVEKAVAVE